MVGMAEVVEMGGLVGLAGLVGVQYIFGFYTGYILEFHVELHIFLGLDISFLLRSTNDGGFSAGNHGHVCHAFYLFYGMY
jgi:hypothetical protein